VLRRVVYGVFHDGQLDEWEPPEEIEFQEVLAQQRARVPSTPCADVHGEQVGPQNPEEYHLQDVLDRLVTALVEAGFEIIRMLGFHPDSLEKTSKEINEEGDGINLYDFVGNLVLMVVDVDGLKWWWPPSWPIWHGPHPPKISPTGGVFPGTYGKPYVCIGISFGSLPSLPNVPPNTFWPPPPSGPPYGYSPSGN